MLPHRNVFAATLHRTKSKRKRMKSSNSKELFCKSRDYSMKFFYIRKLVKHS